MKITPEHRAVLKSIIDPYIESVGGLKTVTDKYQNGDFIRADKCTDLNMRFCFDMLHLSGASRYVVTDIYPYANDDNVYTALRSVLPKLVRNY